MNKYFCKECYYWFRMGGMMVHKNLRCPECHSEGVVKKDLSFDEQNKFRDRRTEKQRTKYDTEIASGEVFSEKIKSKKVSHHA